MTATNPIAEELRELRRLLQGAEDDKRLLRIQLAAEKERSRGLEARLEEMTNHRNRLLEEKNRGHWGENLLAAEDARPSSGGADEHC